MFGLAFCLNAIEMISLDSVGVGALLLGGLFIYDIFWVSGDKCAAKVRVHINCYFRCLGLMSW